MKRKSLIIIILLSSLTDILAQNFDDALRYSQLFYGGTARFMSMGGAFTALGGDISTLSQNPAGLGVFRSSEFVITPQLYHIKTKADLFNGSNSDYIYNFNLFQAGVVGNIISSKQESGLISLNFGYSYNRTNNLYQSALITGRSDNSSFADYWADISYGFYKDELYDNVADADLAYWTGLIDTLPGRYTEYGSIFSYYGDSSISDYGQTINRVVTTEGSTSTHSFSIGGNYSNKILFGVTFGMDRLYYISHYEHLESAGDIHPYNFDDFNYMLHYENAGTGFSFKVGTIIKPVESIRVGLAFHSPTWYRIDEYVYDDMASRFTDGDKRYYDNYPSRFDYALNTPYRLLAGIAVQLKKVALISADYEFVDYASARFDQTGDGYNYSEKNQAIKNNLKSASNLRFGAEMRMNNLYLRGGYSYYGKAFAKGEVNEDMDYTAISCGTGFRQKNVYIDFGYTWLANSRNYILYQSSAGDAISDMKINRNMYTLTFGYKFAY